MLTEDQRDLLEDMQECLDMIDLQIGRIKDRAKETQDSAWPATAYELMDTNGHYLLSPLLIQKAQLLYEISDLETQDRESDVASTPEELCEGEKEDTSDDYLPGPISSNILNWNEIARQQRQAREPWFEGSRYGIIGGDILEPETIRHKLWRQANPSPAFDHNWLSDEAVIEQARDGVMSVNRAREILREREGFRDGPFDPDAGLQPKQKWLQNRLDAINTAIQVRLGTNLPIPHWWNEERAELLEQISRG